MGDRARLGEALGRMPDLVVGGWVCLDFANTVEPRGGPDHGVAPPSREYLTTYADVAAWGVRVGLLGEAEAWRLLAEARRRPGEAQATFTRAITLREAIYRTFWAIAHDQAPRPHDVDVLTREYRVAVSHARLVAGASAGCFTWAWAAEGDALDAPLWPVARSATDLLTTGEPARIKVCPGVPGDATPCAWLFYDASKNRTRRWCSMGDCGSATKTRRQTARRRSARTRRGG